MAGLLAWAADVVGGGFRSDEETDPNAIPLIFTPEQQSYANELDRKLSSLNRSIQDLRLRLPPSDISERLPHLHAHSLASNNALALQLNSHSSTKEQAQLREVRLQEENVEYQTEISGCEVRIGEKLREADELGSRLKEMDLVEEKLREELRKTQVAGDVNIGESDEMVAESKSGVVVLEETEASKTAVMAKLEDKKMELASVEETVRELEEKWQQIQDYAFKQPTPAQREKALDKQLHSLIEQLAAKQAQAEGLVSEIHLKEMELEKLNGLLRRTEKSNADMYTARNRLGRSGSDKGLVSDYYASSSHQKLPIHTAGISESLQRLMLLRSAFVLYILILHIVVFIRISF